MNSNYIKIDETLNSNICLSYYKPDLNDFKLENENNLKRQQEKYNILKEILSSEKKYLSDIREIVEGYYEELKKAFPNDFPYHIFSNIKEIYEFTKTFYSLLEGSTNDEAGIASCFIKKHKIFLKLYSTYCQNYKLAYNTTEKLEKEHNTAKIIQKVRLKYGHCLKLATYLQLPVLRITKYHLLLQRYLKLLEKDSSGYNLVLEALNLMKQVNDQINNEMPKEETSICYERITSTANIQNLIKLFGSIIKQGNLVLNETKKVHYVIIFQTVLVIRKSDSPYKVLHSISNDCLALLPKTSSSASKSKHFTIIDYSQAKDDEMWQFTFKAKSYEDKQSWQSSILSCMLNGYGKKVSDNVKTKVMKMDSFNESLSLSRKSNNEIFKEKINNIKRLTDFRGSVKHELYDQKNELTNLDLDSESSKRRFSTPQSRISKILDRTIENGTISLRRLITKQNNNKEDQRLDKIFSKFRKEKSADRPSSGIVLNKENVPNEFISNSEPKISYNEPIEQLRRSRNSDDLESSFEEISNSTDENENLYEKIKKNPKTPIKELKIEAFNPDTLSKSSMNSEEGYYSSNHDSSLSTLVVDQSPLTDDSVCTLKNFPRTISTPDIIKQVNVSTDCKQEDPFELQNIQFKPNIMSLSMNEPLKSIIYKNYSEPPPERKTWAQLKNGKNLNETIDQISKNPDYMSTSMSSFSRIKNLCNIFEENSLNDLKSICLKSKSINSLQLKDSPRHLKKSSSKINNIQNQILNNSISSSSEATNRNGIILFDSNSEMFSLNVKELINRFENTNKSKF